ncbi:hypothetical protein FRC03_009210 [Tulasnella sp. 419]|nr:hypothetical protein FRC03_009210 [Tulasnella sp. 419]
MSHSHSHRPTLKQENKKFKSRHATKSSIKDLAKGRIVRKSPKSVARASLAAAQTRLNRQNQAKQNQLKKRHELVSALKLFGGVDEKEVDSWGELTLRCLQSQGLPEVITVADSATPPDLKSRPGILKSLLSFIQYFSPSQARVHDLTVPSNALNAARAVCEGRPNLIRWREGRSYLLGESVEWESQTDDNVGKGILKVTGVIRGAPLSAKRLVHIPDFGDFQVDKVMSAPLPRHHKSGANAMSMEEEPVVLSESADDAESLTSRLEPDTMSNEQTWPTEDELNSQNQPSASASDLPDAKWGTTPKSVKKVPRGTSAYQAAWIIEDEDENNEENWSDEEDEGMEEDESIREITEKGSELAVEAEDEDLVELTNEDMESEAKRSTAAFQDLDMEVENQQHAEWVAMRAQEKEADRAKAETEDQAFPDEIDTPRDVLARTRFQKYRGLKSFRTSPWDPYENLPVDYGRIFRFEDYERTRRNVRRKAETEGVQPGRRVTVYIKAVPKTCADSWRPEAPFVLFGLWQHEHKTTVGHFAIQRNTEYDGIVKSKDPLIFCVGPRRFRTNPIFSQHTRGGGKGVNNVHKFERYLRHGNTTIATFYGPMVFGKVPCFVLRENETDGQAPYLVATGTFMNPDTTRIIAKRIVLTGHPFKVHRKTATVRYMFFNPGDVMYFKPIQLHTKHGRTGHITESLGTHGYFKAHFDGVITQMDTICLNLYKRVYPRWSEVWSAPSNTAKVIENGAEANGAVEGESMQE